MGKKRKAIRVGTADSATKHTAQFTSPTTAKAVIPIKQPAAPIRCLDQRCRSLPMGPQRTLKQQRKGHSQHR